MRVVIAILVCLSAVSSAISAPNQYTISGFIRTNEGAAVAGVNVAGSSGASSTVSGADGSYSVTVPNHWSGTITTSKTGWLITSASKTYNRVNSNIANENYIAYQPKISGYVKKADGTALSGASVSASGGASTTTNASGYYEINVSYGWSGTVSASLAGYRFTAKNYTNVITDQANQDFDAFYTGVINVKPDGTGDYPTIQSAINAAVSGIVVILQPGTYTGNGNRDINFMGKAITVRGATGDPNDSVIDCQGDPNSPHRGFKFVSGENNNSILAAVTIKNGYAPKEDVWENGSLYSAGGAIYCNNGSPYIRDCIISNNSASSGGGISSHEAGNPNIENCTIINNSAYGYGGGIYSEVSWPGSTVIKNCFVGGNSGFWGGGIAYGMSTPIIDKCTIVNNSASAYGGGIWSAASVHSTIKNSIISNNSANTYGGGIYNSNSWPEVNNCVISNNSAVVDGGGIENVYNTVLKMNNCSVINNSAGYGGGISNYSTGVVMNNCIIWGNIPSQQITTASASSVSARYCDIQGGYAGTGNINADPCFVDTYHISMASQCFNTGDPNYIPDTNEKDIDGDPRVIVRIDMGADEYADTLSHIILSKQNINFQAEGVNANPPPQSLTITNYGRTRLNWHSENICEWLEIIPLSASLETGETGNITIAVKPNRADYGMNICEFAVVDSNAENSPQVVTVNLDVLRPVIGIDKTNVNFTAHGKSDTSVAAQQLIISNTGYDVLNWHIEIPECNWLIASPSSGQVTDGNNVVMLTVDPSKAPAYGTNNATINIIDTDASNSPKAVTVKLQVSGPSMYLNPPSLYIYAEKNTTIEEAFEIANTGYDILHWNIDAPNDGNWLESVEPLSGQCAAGKSETVTIAIDTNGLNDGQYQKTILIHSQETSSQNYYLYLTVYTPNEIHVPRDYNTIQAAVNAASTGNIIIVHPGKYAGFNLNKAVITIQSIDPENPAIVAATIIESKSGIYSRGTVIKGLSFIYNPNIANGAPDAISMVTAVDAQIENCRVLNFPGNAIKISGQYPGVKVEKCIINNNGCSGTSGSITINGVAYIDNCLITNNFGSGIFIGTSAPAWGNWFYISNTLLPIIIST